jgi:hypothetical protein
MQVDTRIPLLEDILSEWRDVLGDAFPGYSNHCHRVFNFCTALSGGRGTLEKIAIAAAFHDLGIWSAGTFDYLAPSRKLAREYLAKVGKTGWTAEVEAMIDNHHKLFAYNANPDWLVEPFRKADWADISLGRLRWGLPRAYVSEVLAAFPNAGFHRRLVALTMRQIRSHPLRPLPMMKL